MNQEKNPNETQELTHEAANRFKRKKIKEDLIPALESLLDIFPDEIEADEKTLELSPDLRVDIIRTTLATEFDVVITRKIDHLTVGRSKLTIGTLIALARRAVI